MSNIQVTNETNVNNARSECAILINPNNTKQIVATSKRFNDYHNYDFTLATSYSVDGGQSWHDSTAFVLPPGATLMTDPTLAWDDIGNVYLTGLVGNTPPTFDTIGLVVYKSIDGGQTWGAANLMHSSAGDDKQWMAGDTNPGSPYHGRIYVVWDALSSPGLGFARSKDYGATWIGSGAAVSPTGTILAPSSFSPEVSVDANGIVYIVYCPFEEGDTISMLISSDGGDSFQALPNPATGITPLTSPPLGNVGGFNVFTGGTFRVITAATACISGTTIIVAWDDFRENVSRIYYVRSVDGGASWISPPSGQPLLLAGLNPNFQHFFPQLIADPNGVIGCTFYEFGQKPTSYLIDVIMAQSFDDGATFSNFTVTDQPWDPSVDAPWSHGDSSLTFIGDYLGIDASNRGFFPLWTDTRTGIQNLFSAIVPEKGCEFIINRSTLGEDEIKARRMQPANSPGGLPVPDAFRIVVDGFDASALGLSGPWSNLPALPVVAPGTGIVIVANGNTADNGDYGPEVQRFTFEFSINFPDDSAFGFMQATEMLTLSIDVNGVSAAAQIELIKQPNPFILHGDPWWLSVDLRVFAIEQGQSMYGVPGITGPLDAPRFIQQLMTTINSSQFGILPTTEEGVSSLYLYPDEGGTPVFNFALAQVRYIGLIGATNVRVFFRLMQALSTTGAFDPTTSYRRFSPNPDGQPIPLAGIQGDEYVTIPCFASARIDSTVESMDQQTDEPNVLPIVANMGGGEVDTFFGCWLDINQPFKADGVTPNNVLPQTVPGSSQDGPFTDPSNPPQTIQQAILRGGHQCLLAEIAFDNVTIPLGADPSNSDKLAQRNLAWSDVGSAQAVTTFEIKPTQMGLPSRLAPDELMIDWGNIPRGSIASIYLPAVSADTILSMASRMYVSHKFVRADAYTLQSKTGGITYLPIPPGTPINYAGLFSVELPADLPIGKVYTVVVRQVTNAFGKLRDSSSKNAPKGSTGPIREKSAIEWRRVSGAFQIAVPVKNKKTLLLPEERNLSVLKWIGEAIPHGNRWFPVFSRYLQLLGGRVKVFGGDPGQITASPTGNGVPGLHGPGHGPGHGSDHGRDIGFTGKISGLIFDHFGDWEGFVLETEEGERRFFSRERNMKDLAERAWFERLRITVRTDRHDRDKPVLIIVGVPPASFE
jgi:hypothetical protein